MQRAVMTLPPGGGCLLANFFASMRDLSLPYHMRRTSLALRRDLATVADLLQRNMGCGFYRFDDFRRMPAVDTDASVGIAEIRGGWLLQSEWALPLLVLW
eukprot:1270896-Pleurochrysis_carterae.AAC.1